MNSSTEAFYEKVRGLCWLDTYESKCATCCCVNHDKVFVVESYV
jgi:hypothetical protein